MISLNLPKVIRFRVALLSLLLVRVVQRRPQLTRDVEREIPRAN